MKRDNDIRNFFKSSADKTTVVDSRPKEKEVQEKEKPVIYVEDSKPKKEDDIDTKPKKGRKRKGADLDNEDKLESAEVVETKIKKKKINNVKNKESNKIIENPVASIKHDIKIKVDSKGKKIIDDDEDYNDTNDMKVDIEIKIEEKKVIRQLITPPTNTINEDKVKTLKIVNKPEDNKKNLKPIEATSFFRSANYKQEKIQKEEVDKSPCKIEAEKKAEIIVDNQIEKNTIPAEMEMAVIDEFDLDDMDLDILAQDLFRKEDNSNINKNTNSSNEKELSFRNKMDTLEINESKIETLQSNSIMNNRIIKPSESNKTETNKFDKEVKIQQKENLISDRFIGNIINTKEDKKISNPLYVVGNPENSNSLNKKNNTKPDNHVPPKPSIPVTSLLWTDKYHPKSVEDIIGNQVVVKKLIDWLNNWDDVVLNGNKREIDYGANNSFSTRAKNKIENINARACIISGPPGIGKTTTVRLVSKILNYRTFELNASDQRNKQIISSTVGYLMDNKTISNNVITNKNIIIMDEIDGMGGNEDKGGIKALIDIIKKTKLPIVCICNDIQNQKLRNLLNYCYELKFSKPDKRLTVKRLSDICRMEKFNINSESLEYLCESVGNDIRQCLNFLEMRARSSNILNHQEMKSKYNQLYSKDSELMISVFDSCKKMLTRNDFRKLRFGEKMDLFFIDFELLPSLIYENYLTCHGSNKTINDLRRIADSSEHISLGDIIEKKIKRTNEWTLLPNRGIHSCLGPAIYSGNFISYTKFPDLFGKFSKMKKIIRQLKELKQLFNYSFQAIKEEIVPLLFSKITNYLIDLGKEGVDKIVNILHTYKMSLMLFKENLFDLQPSESMLKKYEKLNSGIKSLLTRKLNEEFKTSIVRKKKKGDDGNYQKYDKDGNVIDEISGDEEEVDSEVEGVTNTGGNSKDTKKTKKTKK